MWKKMNLFICRWGWLWHGLWGVRASDLAWWWPWWPWTSMALAFHTCVSDLRLRSRALERQTSITGAWMFRLLLTNFDNVMHKMLFMTDEYYLRVDWSLPTCYQMRHQLNSAFLQSLHWCLTSQGHDSAGLPTANHWNWHMLAMYFSIVLCTFSAKAETFERHMIETTVYF